MASWCWICRRKVDASYRYYKGEKAHIKCIQAHKLKIELAKPQPLKKDKELQTFLPYPDFYHSLSCLDKTRLGNQVYREGITLLRGGWKNHPAKKMWDNHRGALALYILSGLDVLDTKFNKQYPNTRQEATAILLHLPENEWRMPSWLGNENFHRSHRSNLLRKDLAHYSKFFTGSSTLEYIWPIPDGSDPSIDLSSLYQTKLALSFKVQA